MRSARSRVAAFCATIAFALPVAAATTGERVSFPSLDIDPQSGTPIMLTGLFFTPDPSAGGFPAVVALHGCDGMYSTLASRRGRLYARGTRRWPICSLRKATRCCFPTASIRAAGAKCARSRRREQTIMQANRRLDVLGALEYLRTRNDIATHRIALLGWSHGGSAVLAAIEARSPWSRRILRNSGDATAFFVTAIAFYPGCYASLSGARWLCAGGAGEHFHRRSRRLDVGHALRRVGQTDGQPGSCRCR